MSNYRVVDPYTGVQAAEYPDADAAQIEAALDDAHRAFSTWRRTPWGERAELLHRVAAAYRARSDELADVCTREMGKRTVEARGEVDLVAGIYDYYAEHGEEFAATRTLDARGAPAVVRSEPLGALLGIMPWNYPYYQVARFVAPNLMLGNTAIVKPAPNCPESALLIEEIFVGAGLPEGVYRTLLAPVSAVEGMISDHRIAGVSLTGSDRAGRAVGQAAGRALKKVVLELGGSDPFIVLEDADLDQAVAAAVDGRMGNAGQACSASKRFFVVDSVYDEFARRFRDAIDGLRLGDPRDSGTDVGPLSSEAAADGVAAQIADALAHGATALTGGSRPARTGAFVQPTLLVDVPPEARAYREEIFGPVAVLHRAADADDAVRRANDSPYGLGSVIFTSDVERAGRLADQLEAGMVSINSTTTTQEDLPFGGVKASGIGRELGDYGMAEFVNRKLVRIG